MLNEKLNILLCAEYENILAGKRTKFSNAVQKKCNNSVYYVPMLRYVFEEMLKWSPEDVKRYISMDLLRAMKLDQIIYLLDIPTEIDLEEDSFYLAHILYPDLYPYDFVTAILTEYKRKTNDDKRKIRKGFFDDAKGREAAKICLRYAIEKDVPAVSAREIYEYFSDNTRAVRFIRDHKLNNAYIKHYEDPMEYLHDAMLPHMKNELYYQYYMFKRQFKADKKEYLCRLQLTDKKSD